MDEQQARTEPIDIFDVNFRHLGVRSRQEIHQTGAWHQTFHCWYWRMEAGSPVLLIQRRQLTKLAHPGLFDVAVAGHLLAGEQPLDGVRECEEELGLPVAANALTYLGTFRDPSAQANLMDNEFCHVYVHLVTVSLDAYRPALDEIDGLYEIDLADLRALTQGLVESVPVAGLTYSAGQPVRDVGQLSLTNWVSRPTAYYCALWDYFATLGSP